MYNRNSPDFSHTKDKEQLQFLNYFPVPYSLDKFSLSCNIIRMKTGEEIYCIPSLFSTILDADYQSVIKDTRNYMNTQFFKSNYELRSAGGSLSRALGEKLSGDFISLIDKLIFFMYKMNFQL
jgi:hypothetical protein